MTRRSMRFSLRSRYPCRPEERAMTPIEEVIRALRVVSRGTPSVLPSKRMGLSKKKKGRMNPVSPIFTAIRLVFVWSEPAMPLAT